MRVYFSHYGEVYSLNKKDALRLCNDAIDGKGYSMEDYPSMRVLKNLEVAREDGFFVSNGKYKDVHFCLDWDKFEWEEFKRNFDND